MQIFKTLLATLLIATSSVKAQTPENVFSKSYAFEYDGDYSKAINTMLTMSQDSYEVNLRLGWLYYLSKDYTRSEANYRKAMAHEPGSVEARFGLVLPLSALGNWNGVMTTYLDILKLDPYNSVANYRIAYIYYTRKDYVNAASHVSRVIHMYPFDFDSNLLFARIYAAQGKNSEARRYVTRALEYNPQSTDALELYKKL